VEPRNGTTAIEVAPVKKTIYSIPPLIGIMAAANWRYLQFISAIDDPTFSLRQLNKISRPATDAQRSYRGFNLFHGDDLLLFQTINRGEINIRGFQNRDLQSRLNHMNPQQISRHIKRLRKHGLIKKVARTYKYYLIPLLAGLRLPHSSCVKCSSSHACEAIWLYENDITTKYFVHFEQNFTGKALIDQA
jgi:hypothetical protein